MRVTLSIIESDKEISDKILKEIYAQVTKKDSFRKHKRLRNLFKILLKKI